jgi:hypothetical protein
VFDMSEDEGGFGDGADFLGAAGEVAYCAPSADQDGEAAFAEAAQAPEQGIVGARWSGARSRP